MKWHMVFVSWVTNDPYDRPTITCQHPPFVSKSVFTICATSLWYSVFSLRSCDSNAFVAISINEDWSASFISLYNTSTLPNVSAVAAITCVLKNKKTAVLVRLGFLSFFSEYHGIRRFHRFHPP